MTKPASSPTAARTTWHGWQAVELDNGLVHAAIVPAIGGRVMAYDLQGFPFLWVNQGLLGQVFAPCPGDDVGDWHNYGGSKTWPAPQGWSNDDEWHGPPDPVLDGPFALQDVSATAEGASVQVQSPPDPRTGMQFTRRLTLHAGGSCATLHLEMANVSARPRTWSLWEVAQMDAALHGDQQGPNDEAWIYIPRNPRSRYPRGFHVSYGAPDNPEWQSVPGADVIAAQYQRQQGKILVDATAGWAAFVNRAQNMAFCQRCTFQPGHPYPDGGASIECWTNGPGMVNGVLANTEPYYYVEAEMLGPLVTMAPGERASLDIEWAAARCPGPIVDVTAAGCCHIPLHAAPMGHKLRITGVYGVFWSGIAQIAWLDGDGQEIGITDLGPADPSSFLALDQERPVPPYARRMELRLYGQGGRGGVLGRFELL